jgi:hypothetical protein
MAIYTREGKLLLGSPEEREYARRRWAEYEAEHPVVQVEPPAESLVALERGERAPLPAQAPPDPRLADFAIGSATQRAAARIAAAEQGAWFPLAEDRPLGPESGVRPAAERSPRTETDTERIQRTGIRTSEDATYLLGMGKRAPALTVDGYPIATPAAELDLARQRDAERRAERAATANPLVSTALRVGPALIGGAAGTVVPGGTYVGGALGAAVGSELARRYEGRELNPAELVSDVAWGAAPGGSVARVPTTAGKIGARALLGGAMALGQEQTTKAARGEGWLTQEEALRAGGLGALAGGLVEGVTQWRARPSVEPAPDELDQAIAAARQRIEENPELDWEPVPPRAPGAEAAPAATDWEPALRGQAGRAATEVLSTVAGGATGAVTGYSLPADSDEDRWQRATQMGVLGLAIGAGLAPRPRQVKVPELPSDLKARLQALEFEQPAPAPEVAPAPEAAPAQFSPQTEEAIAQALSVPGTTVRVAPGGAPAPVPAPAPAPETVMAPHEPWTNQAKLDRYAQEILDDINPYGPQYIKTQTPERLQESAARSQESLAGQGLSLSEMRDPEDRISRKIAAGLLLSDHPFEQRLAYEVLEGSTHAGRTLNVLSQWSKRQVAMLSSADPAEAHQARLNIAAVEAHAIAQAKAHELERWSGLKVLKGMARGEEGSVVAGYNKVRSNLLGLAVSRLSTTAWNAVSQSGRAGIHMLDLIGRGVFEGKPFRGFGDAMEYGGALVTALRPSERQKLMKYLDFFPTIKEKLNFQSATETQGDLMQLTRWANAPNGLQENYFKTAGAMAELPRVLREEGLDVPTMMRYPGAIPERVMTKVANNTLELVFAAPFTSPGANSFLNLYRRPVPGTLMSMGVRYPRYMGNALKFVANFSPLGLVKPAVYQRATTPAARAKILSQATVGTGMMAAGLMAQQMFRGDTWHELDLPGVGKVDFMKLGPEAVTTLFAGEWLRQGLRYHRGLPPDRDMTDIDLFQGITAGNRLGGAGAAMARWLTGADPSNFPEVAGKMVGEIFGMATVPFEQIVDLLDTGQWLLGDGDGLTEEGQPELTEGQVIRSSRGQGFWENVYLPAQQHVPGLSSYMPEAPNPLGPQPLHHPSPPEKLIGSSRVVRTPLEALAKRLGIEPEELFPSMSDPAANRAWTAAQGRIFGELGADMTTDPEFQKFTLAQQRILFLERLQEARAAAKEEAREAEPLAFLRQEMIADKDLRMEAAERNLDPETYVESLLEQEMAREQARKATARQARR